MGTESMELLIFLPMNTNYKSLKVIGTLTALEGYNVSLSTNTLDSVIIIAGETCIIHITNSSHTTKP